MRNKNNYLGIIREKRASEYLLKVWKCKEIVKTNMAIDKYHAIDFVAQNSKNELIFVQVKGTSYLNKKFDIKAIEFAKRHQAKLYYFYIGNSYKSKVYIKKVNIWNET